MKREILSYIQSKVNIAHYADQNISLTQNIFKNHVQYKKKFKKWYDIHDLLSI